MGKGDLRYYHGKEDGGSDYIYVYHQAHMGITVFALLSSEEVDGGDNPESR